MITHCNNGNNTTSENKINRQQRNMNMIRIKNNNSNDNSNNTIGKSLEENILDMNMIKRNTTTIFKNNHTSNINTNE